MTEMERDTAEQAALFADHLEQLLDGHHAHGSHVVWYEHSDDSNDYEEDPEFTRHYDQTWDNWPD